MFSKIPVPARLLAFGALAVAPFLAACQPPAETFTVDTTADAVDADIGDGVCATAAGTCSLRAAVQEGNTNTEVGPIEVVLPPNIFNLSIPGASEDAGATGDLDMTRPFRLVGQVGPSGPRIGGTELDRLIDVHPGGGVTITDIALSVGQAPTGGLVRAVGANVTLTRVSASFGSADAGGLVSSDGGTLTVVDSVLADGTADAGGAIVADRVVMNRSTVGDAGAVDGAAILLTDPAATSTIDASTFVENAATAGNVVRSLGSPLVVRDSAFIDNDSTGGSLEGGAATQVGNSILDSATGADCSGAVTSLGGNVATGTTCAFTAVNDQQGVTLGDVVWVDTGLGIAPFFDSPYVIDAGTGCLATGQDGAARPADGDTDGVDECDRGPIESELLPRVFTVTTAADVLDAVPGDGICRTSTLSCSLRAAIQEANARPTSDDVALPTGVTNVLSRLGSGEDAGLTGDLDITGDLEIRSNSDVGATIDANDIDRVFDIHAGTVVFDRVTIIDGTEAAGGGGIRAAAGTDVTVRNTNVTQNVAAGGGGGIRTAGELTIDRSLIRSNGGGSSTGGGGLLVVTGGHAYVENGTFYGNNASEGSAIVTLKTAVVDIVDATIVSNTAGPALDPTAATITVRSSIIANNAGGNCAAPVSSAGFNLESAATCGLGAAGDASNTNPLLGALATNGGPTLTLMPAAGSPAVNTAGPCVNAWDQRGQSRFIDAGCDKGAVER